MEKYIINSNLMPIQLKVNVSSGLIGTYIKIRDEPDKNFSPFIRFSTSELPDQDLISSTSLIKMNGSRF